MTIQVYYPQPMYATREFTENCVNIENVDSFTEKWNQNVNDMCLTLFDGNKKVMGIFWNYYGFTFLPGDE